MGNPDLERQAPASPRREPRSELAALCKAVAAGVILALGVWSLCADATARPLLRLQQAYIESCQADLQRVVVSAAPVDASSALTKAERCTVSNMQRDTSYLDGVRPIEAAEFLERRNRLARVLAEEGVDAFVAEPGSLFEYYANVSQSDWEPFEPEERPFLMVIQSVRTTSGAVLAKTSFLAPHFEVARVRMLAIPTPRAAPLDIVVWEEHWDPYVTLRKSGLFVPGGPDTVDEPDTPTLMLDPELRSFIAGGLQHAGFRSKMSSTTASLIPQIKSAGEVAVMRAGATASLAAIRAVRPCLVPGLTEDDVAGILRGALAAVDLLPFINIVLFDANGALPHGGFATGDKVLTYSSMVTVDLGVHHLGHSTEVARTFSIDAPKRGKDKMPKDPSLREKQSVWGVVREAQAAAADAMVAGAAAADVDVAARTVIDHAGYGYAFAQRLGHGVGVRTHEAPYLNKFNRGERLRPGMVFANEPGVYLEGRFGMRLADLYLVKEDGEPELLTGRLSQGLDNP